MSRFLRNGFLNHGKGIGSAAALGGILLLSGCVTGPRYAQPTVSIPSTYKEDEGQTARQPAQAPQGKWWEIFQDRQLDDLEEQIDVSNQNLKAAEASFRQARAALRLSRADLYPTITASSTIVTEKQSKHRALFGATSPVYYSDLAIGPDVTYEADVWGRVRHAVEASRAQAQANAADLAAVNLTLHAELATDYFQLRGLDAERRLLDSTVKAYEQALELTENRYHGGLVSEVDVAQAQTQLETTRAQDEDLAVQRAEYEHAIALLIGRPAGEFTLPFSSLVPPPPVIPAGVPSQLLERRPDITAAERSVAAANQQVGLAAANYFPLVTLNAAAGLEGRSFATWFLGPSSFFNLGPSALVTVFDVGRRRAASQEAMAAYDQTVANYRQTVLTAFQEVEDNLAAIRVLEQEAQTQQAAVAAAERSLALSNNRYGGGVASYLEVTTAQSAALVDERTAVQLLTRRITASVLLIKALGGGWDVSTLPSVDPQFNN